MSSKTDLSALNAAEFGWKQSVLAPSRGEGGVVSGIDVAAVLHDAATECIIELFGASSLISLSHLVVRPVLRAISTTFVGPLTPGSRIVVGVTLGSLSQRSLVLTTALWRAEDSRLLAHGSAEFVVVEAASRRPVALPANVVDGLQRLHPPPLPSVSSQPANQANTHTS